MIIEIDLPTRAQPRSLWQPLSALACGPAHARAKHIAASTSATQAVACWSPVTGPACLADHRGDRKAWLLSTLDLPASDPARYSWEPVTPADDDYMPHSRRLLHVLADRARWQAALTEARRKAQEDTASPSATGRAA